MEPRTTSNNNPKRMSTMTGIWEDARKLDNEESSVSQSRPPDIETRRRGFSRRTTIDEALGVDITGLLRDTNTRNDNVVPRSSNVGDPEPNSQSSFVKASQMDRGEIHSRLSRNVDGSSYRRRHIEDHFNLQHPGPERHSILSSSFGVGEEAGDRGLRGVRNNYSDDPWAIRPLPPTAGRGGHHNQVPSSANGTFSLLKESKGKPVEFSSYDDDCDDRSEQGLRTLRPPEQDELRRIPPPPPTPTPRRYRRRGGKAERRKPASDTVEAGAGKQGASVYQHRYSGVDASTVQPFRRNDADNGGYPFPSSSSSSGGIFRPFDVQTRCSADSNVFSDFAPVSDRASCSSWSLPSVVEPNPSLKRKLINGAKSLMRLGMKRGAGEGSSGRKKVCCSY